MMLFCIQNQINFVYKTGSDSYTKPNQFRIQKQFVKFRDITRKVLQYNP